MSPLSTVGVFSPMAVAPMPNAFVPDDFDVPTSTVVAMTGGAPMSWIHGHEVPFDAATVAAEHGERYGERVAASLKRLVAERVILPEDAAAYFADASSTPRS